MLTAAPTAVPLSPSAFAASEPASAFALAPANLHSVSFTAKITYGNQHELRKISEDFGKTYRFQYAKVKMEAPFKIRVESVVEDQSVLVIGDGDNVLYKVPRAGIHSQQNLLNQPGRRQTFLDFGLLNRDLGDFFASKFVRKDRATGDDVYDLTYRRAAAKDTTRYRIWINPERHMVDRKEWYGQIAEFRAAFTYTDAKRVDGVWVPTKLSVSNADGKLAGQMSMVDVQVNPDLPASTFKF